MPEAFNPYRLLLDDGRAYDTSTASGLGLKNAGVEQNRLRRGQIMGDNAAQAATGSGFGPMRSIFHGLGLGPNPEWDGLFGVMQAQENQAASQGLNYRVGLPGRTKREALYKPTWDPHSQSSAVGSQFMDSRGDAHFARRDDPRLAGLRAGRG